MTACGCSTDEISMSEAINFNTAVEVDLKLQHLFATVSRGRDLTLSHHITHHRKSWTSWVDELLLIQFISRPCHYQPALFNIADLLSISSNI